MPKFEDLTGQKFGRLTVLSRAENRGKQICWLCRCACGSEKIVPANTLKNGHTKSCGCLQREKATESSTKHGMRSIRTYNVWSNMKQRCLNSNNQNFNVYGGRGIKICAQWIDNFQAFYDYISKLPHFGEDGYTLDRINVNGNYEPGNLRFATAKEQRCNQRGSIIIVEYNGESMTLTEAAKKSGINYGTLKSRYKHGDREDKLFRPVKHPHAD